MLSQQAKSKKKTCRFYNCQVTFFAQNNITVQNDSQKCYIIKMVSKA